MAYQLTAAELALLGDAAEKPLTQSRRPTWSKDYKSRAWHEHAVAGLVRRGFLAIDDDGDLGRRAIITPHGRQSWARTSASEDEIANALGIEALDNG